MIKTALDLAHEEGVKLALKQCGYSSIEEVEKEAAALGLLESPKTAADSAVAFLKKKLG
jgi:hypothetical protein